MNSVGIALLSNVRLWTRFCSTVAQESKRSQVGGISVKRPTKFEFVINLKTAKQIGLTIRLPCWRGRTG
jgi:hypothetical protein